MSNLGGLSNFPFALGGDPSDEEKTYNALLRMVGEGASPPGDTFGDATIFGAWRMARAVGLVAFGSTAEAALYQAFPDTVTDELESYEEILSLFPAPEDSEEKRRRLVTERWTGEIRSTYPAVGQQLQSLDSRLSLVAPDRLQEGGIQFGVMFDPSDVVSPLFMGSRKETQYPNYSDSFVMRALFDIGAGALPTAEIQRTQVRVEEMLGEVLPAWCDFGLIYGLGFLLDISLLDLTGLSP